MNLTVTPYNNYKHTFEGRESVAYDAAEKFISNTVREESGLFRPFTDAYDKFTDGVAEKFTSRLLEFKPLNDVADFFKDSSNLYQHCLTIGSVITSGLYMQRTYTNKNLDKDRRNTLVVNQGLTLGVSTAGAYLLDKYLKSWWENLTARFAGHLLNDEKFYKDFITKKNNAKLNKTKLPKLDDMIKLSEKYKNPEFDKTLMDNKIKGMGLLRSMIVFGFVYRFFVPVVVTKPANKLCDMYLQHKKEKEAQLNKTA